MRDFSVTRLGRRAIVRQSRTTFQRPLRDQSGTNGLLKTLLREGADTMRAGDPVLELARVRGAGRDMLELIMKYNSGWDACTVRELWEKERFYFCFS